MSRLSSARQLVVGEQVGRVGHADQQRFTPVFQHQRAEAARLGFRQLVDQIGVGIVKLEIDEWDLQLACDSLGDPFLGDEAIFDEDAAQLASAAFLLGQCLLQLVFGEQILLDQYLAQPDFFRFGHRRPACSCCLS